MFSEGLPNEVLIRTRQDSDFGRLELWRWHDDSPVIVDWRGRVTDERRARTPLSIPADPTNPDAVFDFIDRTTRDTYRNIARNPADVRLAVARYELGHAEDWAYQADLPPPTLESFSASLQISEIVLSARANSLCFEVWLEETRTGFFAGHNILATFDAHGVFRGAGLG